MRHARMILRVSLGHSVSRCGWSMVLRKFAVALSFACLGVLSSQATALPATSVVDASAVFERVAPSIVTVQVRTQQGTSLGSGVVVDKGLVVTNYHVVANSIGFVVLRQAGLTWRAEVEAYDEKQDLALLGVVLRRTEIFGLPVARRKAAKSLRVGERVFAVGSPRGLERTLSDGLVSGLPADGDRTMIQTTAAISPGSSGGGLFDAKGNLVAITTQSVKDSQNLNFAVPVEYVDTLEHKAKSSPATTADDASAGPGSVGESTATGPAPYIAVPIGLSGMRAVVLSVSSEGPIAFEGGVSKAWLAKNLTRRMSAAGIAVFASQEAANKEGYYAHSLVVSVASMNIDDSVFYPWRINVDVMEFVDFADGAYKMVSVWQDGSFGFGGSSVVVEQVSSAVLKVVGRLADDVNVARNAKIRPRVDHQ